MLGDTRLLHRLPVGALRPHRRYSLKAGGVAITAAHETGLVEWYVPNRVHAELAQYQQPQQVGSKTLARQRRIAPNGEIGAYTDRNNSMQFPNSYGVADVRAWLWVVTPHESSSEPYLQTHLGGSGWVFSTSSGLSCTAKWNDFSTSTATWSNFTTLGVQYATFFWGDQRTGSCGGWTNGVPASSSELGSKTWGTTKGVTFGEAGNGFNEPNGIISMAACWHLRERPPDWMQRELSLNPYGLFEWYDDLPVDIVGGAPLPPPWGQLFVLELE